MKAPPGNGGAESAQNKRNSLPVDSAFRPSPQAPSFPEALSLRKAVGPVTACAMAAPVLIGEVAARIVERLRRQCARAAA